MGRGCSVWQVRLVRCSGARCRAAAGALAPRRVRRGPRLVTAFWKQSPLPLDGLGITRGSVVVTHLFGGLPQQTAEILLLV